MSHKSDLLAGINLKVNSAPAAARKAFMARCDSRTVKELERVYDTVEVNRAGKITFEASAPKSQKKTTAKTKANKDEEKDALGFKKKDYPLIMGVGLVAGNILAFKSETAIAVLIAILLDILVAYLLYRKYGPKKVTRRTIKTPPRPRPASMALPEDIQEKTYHPKKGTPGLFGIQKRHYPILIGVVAVLLNVTAFTQGAVPMIVAAVVADVGLVYLGYRRFRARGG